MGTLVMGATMVVLMVKLRIITGWGEGYSVDTPTTVTSDIPEGKYPWILGEVAFKQWIWANPDVRHVGIYYMESYSIGRSPMKFHKEYEMIGRGYWVRRDNPVATVDPVKDLSERDRARWVEFVDAVANCKDVSDICQDDEVMMFDDHEEEDPEITDFLAGHPCPSEGPASEDPSCAFGRFFMNESQEPELPGNYDIGCDGCERAR